MTRDGPAQDGTTASQRAPPQVEDLLLLEALQDEPPVMPSTHRRSTRHSAQHNQIEYDRLRTSKGLKHASMQFNSSQHRSNRVKSYCVAIVSDLMLSSNQSYDNQYLLNFLLTYDFGLYENLGADTLRNHPHAMKASMTHDPDNP